MLTKPPFSRARLALVAAAAVAIQLAGCDAINEMLHPTPPIRFAPAGESKADLAMVEHDFPLTMDELQKLTPDNLKNFSQEQLDQIYARLAAGPIPDGAFDGGLVFPKGESGQLTSLLWANDYASAPVEGSLTEQLRRLLPRPLARSAVR